jgi:iron complex transport system substrate-binding protein
VPDKLTELAADRGWQVHAYHIETLADAMAALRGKRDGDGRVPGIGEALGVAEAADDLAAAVERKLAAIARVTAARPRPRVLALISQQPLTAVGPGTFLHEILGLAGAENVMADAAAPYPSLTLEKVIALQPDVIIVLDMSDGLAEWAPPAQLASLNIPAAQSGRIARLSGQTIGLPSTTVVDTTLKLVSLLHPDLAKHAREAVESAHP